MVKDEELQTPIPSALFSIPEVELATTTSEKGTFEISLPEGTYLGFFSSIGKSTHRLIIIVYQDLDLEISLFESVSELDLVILIRGRKFILYIQF